MEKPAVIHWMITSRCNLNCPHCFSFRRKDLSLKKNLIIAQKIVDLGVKKIVISGGEPLVREDIFEIIDFLKAKRMTIRLDTNGLLLPKNIHRLANLDSVGISLDGSTAEVDQKLRRNKNHFKSVISSLEKLKKSRIKIIIHTLAVKLNIDDIPSMAKLLEKYPIQSWGIFEYYPAGPAFKNRKKFELKRGQYEEMMKKIKYKRKIDFCRIKDRIKAYYFIDSDGCIYTQPKKFGYDYPIFGNILIDEPTKYFKIVNAKNNLGRSRLVK